MTKFRFYSVEHNLPVLLCWCEMLVDAIAKDDSDYIAVCRLHIARILRRIA